MYIEMLEYIYVLSEEKTFLLLMLIFFGGGKHSIIFGPQKVTGKQA